jgi:hypothetical protein
MNNEPIEILELDVLNDTIENLQLEEDTEETVNTQPKFSVIKNYGEDLSSKTFRCDHTGADCARWLVNYCKENGLQIPKCFAHTANNKQRPVLNDILGINESNTIKVNESQLRNIIKETILEYLRK